MTPEQLNKLYTARWMVMEKWGHPDLQDDVVRLISEAMDVATPEKFRETTLTNITYTKLPASKDKLATGATKIAIVVGHNAKQPGAGAKAPLSTSEFTYNNQIADRMVELAPESLILKRFNRVYTGSYSSEIRKVYADVKAWGAKAAIELHFNAGGGAGSETLHAAGSSDLSLAKAMQAAQLSHLQLIDRGLKATPKSGRGGASLFALSIPIVLMEPFFGDNSADVSRAAKLGIDGMAKMYLAGLTAYVAK